MMSCMELGKCQWTNPFPLSTVPIPSSSLCDDEAASLPGPALSGHVVMPFWQAWFVSFISTHSLWLIYPTQTEINGLASEHWAAHVPGTFGSLIAPLQFGEYLSVLGRGLLSPRRHLKENNLVQIHLLIKEGWKLCFILLFLLDFAS